MHKLFYQRIRSAFAVSNIRKVIVLAIVMIIVITMVGLMSFLLSRTLLEKELLAPQNMILQIDQKHFESLFTEVNDTSLKVINNLVSTDYKAMDTLEAAQYRMGFLTDLCYNNVKAVYIFDITEQSITASAPHGYYSDVNTFYDIEWVKNSLNFFGQRNHILLQRPQSTQAGEPEFTFFRLVENDDFKGVIAVDVNWQRFCSSILEVSSARYILDNQNNIVFAFGDVLPPKLITATAEYENSTNDILSIDNTNYLFTMSYSEMIDWRFFTFVSLNDRFYNITLVRNVILIICGISILVCLVAIKQVHEFLYRPIRRINELILMDAEQHHEEHVDVKELEKITAKLMNSYQEQRQNAAFEEEMLRSIFLGNIINKKLSKTETLRRWRSLLLSWNDSPTCIVVLSVDKFYSWHNEFSPSDVSLMEYAIVNISNELFSNGFKCVHNSDSENVMVFLLQCIGEHEHFVERLNSALQAISHSLQKHLLLSVSFGVSKICNDPENIHLRFQEAVSAIESRLYNGYNGIYTFNAECHKYSNELSVKFYGDRHLSDISTALRAKKYDFIATLLRSNIEFFIEKQLYPQKVVAYLQKVIAILEQKEVESKIALLDQNAICSMYILDILKCIQEYLENIENSTQSIATQAVHQTFIKVKNYIQDNYKHDLSLNDIALECGLSVSTVSNAFKKESGKTVYEYLTQVRMDKARDMLREQTFTVAQIAKEVGYQNETSFRRVFKKTFQKTPTDYRDL